MDKCPNHLEKNIYCKGLCRKCYEKQLKELNPSYHEKQLKNSRDWHSKNKERVAEQSKIYRKKVGKKTEQRFFAAIYKKYKFTKNEYLYLLKKSDNKCNLCGREPYEGKKLHLDNDHLTGKVRGLLCTRCNWYLATIEKDLTILDRIKVYINEGKKI